ncbi:MAG: retention module-containing protein, partial [Gammaproteobacteria bacterium]
MPNLGVVQELTGVVTAKTVDGTERILQEGDKVQRNEHIITGDKGTVVIEFSDGNPMVLGRDFTVKLDADTLSPGNDAKPVGPGLEKAKVVVGAMQALLEDENFDPSTFAATAAGGNPAAGATADDGSTFVSVEYLNPDETPESGFSTTGISHEFLDPDGELILDPTQPLPIVSVEVKIEINPENPPQTPPPTDGIPTEDHPVLLSGNDAIVKEGTTTIDGDYREVTFILSLDQVFDQDVTVTYQLVPVSTNNAADNPADWFDGEPINTVVIPAGTQTFLVPVKIVQDHLDEGNGVFEIRLIDVVNATINPNANAATVTIFDDDTTPVANEDTNWVQADPVISSVAAIEGNVLTTTAHPDDPSDVLEFTDQADTDADGDTLVVTGIVSHGANGALGGGDDTIGTIGTPLVGVWGTLTLQADGSYSYEAGSQTSDLIFSEQVNDIFTYTVTDTYNEPQTSTLTITILGGDSGVEINGIKGEGPDLEVDEDGLAGASADESPFSGETDSTESTIALNTFTVVAPDGVDTVTIDGHTVISNGSLVAAPSFTTDLGNTFEIISYDSNTGVITYKYTLESSET